MNQQQLQLRLLQEKHLNNMLNLEKQRELLAKQNPYKQQISVNQHLIIHPSHLPILKPDAIVQKILYYPPSQGESQVAQRVSDSILLNWNRECENIPDDVYLRNLLKGQKRIRFQKELTPKGYQQVQQILKYARKNNQTRAQLSIRQKYSLKQKPSLFLPTNAQQLKERPKF